MVFDLALAKIPPCHSIVKAVPDQWYKILPERRFSSGELFCRGLTFNLFIVDFP